jgi:hypothetical protein
MKKAQEMFSRLPAELRALLEVGSIILLVSGYLALLFAPAWAGPEVGKRLQYVAGLLAGGAAVAMVGWAYFTTVDMYRMRDAEKERRARRAAYLERAERAYAEYDRVLDETGDVLKALDTMEGLLHDK